MSDFTVQGFLSWLPDLLIGLLILLVGFIIAKVIQGVVYKLLRKFRMNERLGTTESKWNIEKIISKVVFWGIMLLALIMFLNVMNMSLIATPFVSIYSGFAGAILGILKAAIILFIAWILALVVKKFILMAGNKLNLNKYFVKAGVSAEEANKSKWIENAANIAFYLILLLFMPAVLHALGLSGVSGPFEGLLQGFLNFIPKLVGAAIIFVVGFIVAKIIRVILTKFLESIGTDRFADKLKISSFLKGTSLSKLVGTIAFILIMIPVTISSLEALDLRGISEPAIAMLHDIVGMIPKIIIGIVLVLVGVLLAKWIKGVVVSLLENLGVNSLFGKMGVRSVKPSMPSLAEIIGTIVQIVVILLFVVEALQVVNLHFMVSLATGIFAYLPMVLAAVVILAVGFWLANLAERFVGSVMTKPSGAPHVLRYVAKYAILAFAFFMALSQLGIAPAIINAAFILILGGVALAFGLAFGLGGREHASRYLSEMESSLQGAEVSKTKWEQEKAEVKNEVEDVINNAEVDPNKSTPGQDTSYNEPKPGERYPYEGEGNDDPIVP
ncbi:mechanosensitive ion channel [Sporosarcina sp. Marseille-Q4063]|uniref:mechanosensitive ion channel n=1 Tax=Sporosarcina sp. Marseille-Q4063 TaxID=2810514 RepID=UPI001BAF6325|nr:mechanosensitive ion channel [Sporosarcina sp. Marseille-Q4063]QUW20982.1 mechanosensitive ion channel [Sporosarcina sp. Marseille-Q4063]